MIGTVLAGPQVEFLPPPQARDVVQQPARDPNAPPPTRQIPVGTASISGTITAVDTGRPVRGARVTVSGNATMGIGALATPRGAAMGSPPSAPIGRGNVPVRGGSNAVALVSRSVLTDAAGQFSVANLPAGTFRVGVTRTQLLSANFGQKRQGAPGTAIQLSDGQKFTANIQMIRGGVISGTVYGDTGDPVGGAQVRSWRYVMDNGTRRLQGAAVAGTDDRGTYRLFNLQPGDYIVSATPSMSDEQMFERLNADAEVIAQTIASGAVQPPAVPGWPATISIPIAPVGRPTDSASTPAYLPTYHPSAPARLDASLIHVTGGDEQSGKDIQLQYVQAGSIEGIVSHPAGLGAAVQVWLVSEDPAGEAVPAARVDPNGRFAFSAVAPGKYTLFALSAKNLASNGITMSAAPVARPRSDDSQTMWGRAPVTVSGSVTATASIQLGAGRSISGVVVFDMEKAPDLSRGIVTVMLSRVPSPLQTPLGPSPQAVVDADGRFTLSGVAPGRYTLAAVYPASGPRMKSAIVNGEDVLDMPLDFTGERDFNDAVLTLTDKRAECSGVVADASGKPIVDADILAVSADPRFWTVGSRRIQTMRSGADGHYTFYNLAPGDYLLAAFSDFVPGSQYDPEFLRTVPNTAVRVTVTEGAKVTQDLRIGG